MTLKAETDIRNRYIIPLDIMLKTTEEYEYSKKSFFDSELII